MSARRTRRDLLAFAAGALSLLASRRLRASESRSAPPTAPSADARARPSLFAGAPAADDPLELLYSRRLSFDGGQPLITVRVLEGREQATVISRAGLQAFARTADGKSQPLFGKREGPAGRWRVELLEARPGLGSSWVELEQVRYADKEGRDQAKARWSERGFSVRVSQVGDVYGIAGHVVDTRRWTILAEGDATEHGAQAQAAEVAEKFGIRPQIHREQVARPTGRIGLKDARGKLIAEADGALELRCARGLDVEQVEYGMGYAAHGFEQRSYPGRLYACIDAQGKLALVAAVPMERLVKGVVPSEIFAKAHLEALKAQAVTARGEVLAKVGARHLGDPYLLCAEQHCQVYKGIAAEQRSTDAAADATRGEALFSKPGADGSAPRHLVDSVYSACCGGFTEDNDVVWGGPPDPSLRGRPDFDLSLPALAKFRDGIGELHAADFVRLSPVPSYCALSGLAPPDKVRWTRSFTQEQLDKLCGGLGVGKVAALVPEGRGASGRLRALHVTGESGEGRIYGELNVRKAFQMLPSGMFIVDKRDDGSWLFRGGGWGHGSGMCQLGAIGRAQRGQSYRDILGWYYSGSRPERIY